MTRGAGCWLPIEVLGITVADDLVDEGADLLVTGDMGIANTTPAAALVAGASPAPTEQRRHR